jgi:DNA-binding PadR family transcriptional regulator
LRRGDILYNVCVVPGPLAPALETAVLLAVARLGDGAYGAAVQREVGERGGRAYAVGAIHTALQRLEDKGLVTSHMGEPLAVRGGRARRYYRVTAAGAAALEQARTAARRLWQTPGLGLEPT